MTQIIKLDIDFTQYALEVAEAETVKSAFVPVIESVQKYDTEFFDVIAQPISPELTKKAGELRKKLVKERTNTATVHKSQKSYYLNGGRMVDGLKNKITECIEKAEQQLDDIENHYVNIEKARVAKLHAERLESLKQFEYVESGLAFGGMPEADWNHYFAGVKATYEQKIAEDKRLEQERKDKEAETERLRVENEALKSQTAKLEQVIIKKEEVEKKEEDTIKTLIVAVESLGFSCEKGTLQNCQAWINLKKLII